MIVFIPTAALYLAGAYGAWSTSSAFAIVMLVFSLLVCRHLPLQRLRLCGLPGRAALHSPLLPVSYIASACGAAPPWLSSAWLSSLRIARAMPRIPGAGATAAAVFLFLLELAMSRSDATVSRSLGTLTRVRWPDLLSWEWCLWGSSSRRPCDRAYPASIGVAGLLIAGSPRSSGPLLQVLHEHCRHVRAARATGGVTALRRF